MLRATPRLFATTVIAGALCACSSPDGRAPDGAGDSDVDPAASDDAGFDSTGRDGGAGVEPGDAGAGADGDGSDVTSGPPSPDSGSAPDECFGHVDCFSGIWTCVDGVVRRTLSGPVDCRDWTGECPWVEEYACEGACADGDAYAMEPAEALLCAGRAHSPPGDHCLSDDGCVPRPTRYDEDGRIVVDYLVCDHRAERCAAGEPPPALDFGAPCDTRLAGRAEGGTRVAESRDCELRTCVDRWDDSSDCLRVGCSRRCQLDRDCPLGARCELEVEEEDADPLFPWPGACVPAAPFPSDDPWVCVPTGSP